MCLVSIRRQAEITDSNLTRRPVDENVVTLQITMNYGRVVAVKVVESIQNLSTPFFNDFKFDAFDTRDVLFQRA